MRIDNVLIGTSQMPLHFYAGVAKKCKLPNGGFCDMPITSYFTEREEARTALELVENLPEGATDTGIGMWQSEESNDLG